MGCAVCAVHLVVGHPGCQEAAVDCGRTHHRHHDVAVRLGAVVQPHVGVVALVDVDLPAGDAVRIICLPKDAGVGDGRPVRILDLPPLVRWSADALRHVLAGTVHEGRGFERGGDRLGAPVDRTEVVLGFVRALVHRGLDAVLVDVRAARGGIRSHRRDADRSDGSECHRDHDQQAQPPVLANLQPFQQRPQPLGHGDVVPPFPKRSTRLGRVVDPEQAFACWAVSGLLRRIAPPGSMYE